MNGIFLYRAAYLEHTATYQDMTFHLLMFWWLLTTFTVSLEKKMSHVAPHCIALSIPLMYVIEQRGWFLSLRNGNVIDNFWERLLAGADWVVKTGKPDNFTQIITTYDLYTYLYTAQLVVLMVLLAVGVVKAKGVKKYAPKKRKKKPLKQTKGR
ncbi:hypothetical protein OTK49_01830 [Vibrio coralliirubri]|uniref:hypothetical protein n=1 Tax=Vibrio coralliirubri TaxID=1516159 RepID=UPI002283CE63|nr:hypothetical protein [Vibrio coralliirubri]MCY9861253.1 hypothetical protein [Vibrio coralliirubri]